MTARSEFGFLKSGDQASGFKVTHSDPGVGSGQSGGVRRLKIFLVEDEAMIRMMVVDMLEELGHTIAAEAGHLEKAIVVVARSTDFDFAILDVNLGGKNIAPVAAVSRSSLRPATGPRLYPRGSGDI